MPEDGQYKQNMWHLLTRLIKFVIVDGTHTSVLICVDLFCNIVLMLSPLITGWL